MSTDLLNPPEHALIRLAPKVLLHDHLDGGLRPSTVLEIAAATGYDGLPATNPDDQPLKLVVSITRDRAILWSPRQCRGEGRTTPLPHQRQRPCKWSLA